MYAAGIIARDGEDEAFLKLSERHVKLVISAPDQVSEYDK